MVKVIKLESTEKKEIKLMPGSQNGAYFPFARKGDVLLGIRPSGVYPGASMGVSQTTYFACRLRSAPSHGLFAEEDAAKKVVKLVKEPANLWDAWPGVTWEKKDPKRASTTIGAFIKGEFKSKDPTMLKTLLAEISGGKLSSKLAAYLIELARPSNALVTVAELKEWLDGQFNPMIEQIVKRVEQSKVVEAEMSKSVGNFGMQAAILKKAFEGNNPDEVTEDEPDDDGYDPDNMED